MRSLLTTVGVEALFVLGVLAVVLGGADDSPGLQGIGGFLIVASVVLGVRAVRRRRGNA
ncbi:hypothetical protein JKP75_03755 [Blastococcus sp. TML/M2B]|uniref:hypothetical protein n=1 Tax=unclassified Blastococcus TaxID=2619396 RepID=UPI00190A4251|nr:MULTISPECIES: hypothetical protein [unclassified Blastococcus]MBN1091764.1 hypothetical protein [Blastococcus sp. TML/M2B]MBN1094680.1 hypothetical protein [Blastococcus sp. TML/C7B]